MSYVHTVGICVVKCGLNMHHIFNVYQGLHSWDISGARCKVKGSPKQSVYIILEPWISVVLPRLCSRCWNISAWTKVMDRHNNRTEHTLPTATPQAQLIKITFSYFLQLSTDNISNLCKNSDKSNVCVREMQTEIDCVRAWMCLRLYTTAVTEINQSCHEQWNQCDCSKSVNPTHSTQYSMV